MAASLLPPCSDSTLSAWDGTQRMQSLPSVPGPTSLTLPLRSHAWHGGSRDGRSLFSQVKAEGTAAEQGHPHRQLSLGPLHTTTGRKDVETSPCSGLSDQTLSRAARCQQSCFTAWVPGDSPTRWYPCVSPVSFLRTLVPGNTQDRPAFAGTGCMKFGPPRVPRGSGSQPEPAGLAPASGLTASMTQPR